MTSSSPFRSDEPGSTALDYDAIVDQFYEGLYRFALGLSGKASDAADLTQETYHILLVKGDRIRDPNRVKSWLFTTLYREFLRRRRHLTRFPELDLAEVDSELPAVESRHMENLDAALVLDALQALADNFRAPLAMFYLENLSYKEIAEILQLPLGTVMSRLSRGKAQLRQRLQASLAPDARTFSEAKDPTSDDKPQGWRQQMVDSLILHVICLLQGPRNGFWLDRPDQRRQIVRVKRVWPLQEAKNQFSRVVDQALTQGIQTITRHGKAVVVILAAEEYRQLKPRRKTVEVLRGCPVEGLDVSRVKDRPRGVVL
jgi:RNA polymerase sigma-70 factor, ECF subfamily